MTEACRDNGNGNNNIAGGGLLGKLLLPSYTDAGANTSFQHVARVVSSDQGSQAATEVRDNRSSIKQQFRINAYKHHSQYDTASIASSVIVPPNQIGDLETRYSGFFPSTKPQVSPRPSSPPSVERQQTFMMSSVQSVAGTSVVPETGAIDFSVGDTVRSQTSEGTLEKEKHNRIYYWENEGATQSHIGNLKLNAANLQKTEKDRARNTLSPTDASSAGSPRPNRNTSLLSDEDVRSDVMSTASEMGTVIEIGNHAARMAEIDAMAALIEASPNVESLSLTPRLETFPPAPSRTPLSRTTEDTVSSLALPELDSKPNLAIMLAPQTKANPIMAPFTSDQDLKGHSTLTNPTPAEMLTSALRRIGTGLNKTKASLSAPPTPRTPGMPPTPRIEDLLKSSLTPIGFNGNLAHNLNHDLPPSLALRSPGSSARLSLRHRSQQYQDDDSTAILAPRFSPTHPTKILQSSPSFDSALRNDRSRTVKAPKSSLSNLSRRESTEPLKLNPLSPFRLAQKCFSYDSTLDEHLDTDSDPGSATSSHILNLESSYPVHRRTQYHRTQKIQESVSWDVGGASAAFRTQPHRSHRVGGLRSTTSQLEHNAQRARVHSDFSLGRMEVDDNDDGEHIDKLQSRQTHHNSVLKLQTPDRFVVDVEREDALDILACLVERGVAVSYESCNNMSTNDSTESSGHTREALVATMVEKLRTSLDENNESDSDQVTQQIIALEELLKSHAYATEMKRAALSALTWLRSIGRGPPLPDDNELHESATYGYKRPSEVGQASGEDAASDKQSDTNSSFSAAAADSKLEILTLKARLHSTENELREKIIMNEKLDEELCKCRAEIGRLRTAFKNETTTAYTHSFIDDEVEDSVTASTVPSIAVEPRPKDDAPPCASTNDKIYSQENKLFDESFQGNNSLFQDLSMQEDRNCSAEAENLDVLVLKTALEQANDTIRLLHEKLQKDVSDDERNVPPTNPVPEIKDDVSFERNDRGTKSPTVPSDEHRTINVRMLDGENFVTEWDDLTSPLPPPPDHGLRSPIVSAVLEQWTDDQNLHQSLLSWMDRVMTGDKLEDTVPPLTISSLDHQVRDGFIMHVLPLLLRRADIHVAVQMRAHRRTTYDLAVSVNQKQVSYNKQSIESRSPSLLDQHVHDDWDDKHDQVALTDSGSHSAITIPVENVFSRNSQLEDLEYSHFGIPNSASEDMEDNPQSTFMGALGGALGGLLSRGKHAAVQSPSRFSEPVSRGGFPPSAIRSPLGAATSLSSGNRMAELDYQPYHRVVSAPPGRIGVTFVEYRGHAMVADMAPDSPLSSWVFPSDILIAVDEVPVSGMRVRDIIKILTNRKDRQRALRVISSHAMNEFTLNQSALGDEAP